MNFQIPGKTFLVGEYSALVGGAALGLATAPYFKLNYNVDVQAQYHPESAAGLFLNNKNINVNIEDEYLNNNVKGGFGKSTAEYFSVIIPDIIKSKKHFSDIHSEYKKLFINENVKPSGADLAFQYFGQVCLADSAIQFYQTLNWHFENLDFYIISTGLKIPTHEHIKSLNLNDLKKLVPISNQVIEAFVQNKEFEFLSLMKQWVVTLKENNLTHENSINMCNELEKFPAIKLAKPCGALGADVILIFFAKTQKNDVEAFLNQSKYNIQAGSEQLSGGLLNQLDKYWSECVD